MNFDLKYSKYKRMKHPDHNTGDPYYQKFLDQQILSHHQTIHNDFPKGDQNDCKKRFNFCITFLDSKNLKTVWKITTFFK